GIRGRDVRDSIFFQKVTPLPGCGRAACIYTVPGEAQSRKTLVKNFLTGVRLPPARFAAVSIAGLPMPHFPGLYQKATPKTTNFALNRRGRDCGSSGT